MIHAFRNMCQRYHRKSYHQRNSPSSLCRRSLPPFSDLAKMLCKLNVTRRGLASNVKNSRSANHQLRWWTLKLHYPFQQRNWSIKSKFSWIRSRFNLLAQKFKTSYSVSVAQSPQFNRGHPFSEELEYECGLETVKPWAAIGTEPWMRQ